MNVEIWVCLTTEQKKKDWVMEKEVLWKQAKSDASSTLTFTCVNELKFICLNQCQLGF